MTKRLLEARDFAEIDCDDRRRITKALDDLNVTSNRIADAFAILADIQKQMQERIA